MYVGVEKAMEISCLGDEYISELYSAGIIPYTTDDSVDFCDLSSESPDDVLKECQ